LLQTIQARQTVFFVLNGNAPPNVRQPCRKLEIVLEQLLHPFGALCEDLVGVPIGDCHHLEGCDDEPIRTSSWNKSDMLLTMTRLELVH